jgi:hypothetical protein
VRGTKTVEECHRQYITQKSRGPRAGLAHLYGNALRLSSAEGIVAEKSSDSGVVPHIQTGSEDSCAVTQEKNVARKTTV